MASPHGTNKRRHVFCDAADTEDTNTHSKRICIESSLNPAGLDSPFNPSKTWDTQPYAVFPNAQGFETASEPLNGLKSLPSTQSTAEQYNHDAFSSLPNYEQIPGATYEHAGYWDTVLGAQTPPPEYYTTEVVDASQFNDEIPAPGFTAHYPSAQQLNSFAYGWENGQIGLSIDQRANPATPLSYHRESSPQEGPQRSTFAQHQSFETDFLPRNFEKSVIGLDTNAGLLTEWFNMKNQAHPMLSEMTKNTILGIEDQSPTISEYGNTVPGGSNLKDPASHYKVSSPSSFGSTEHNACDNVYVPKSKTETPQSSQYDACFGVVTTTAMSTFTGSSEIKQAPVSIAVYGDMLEMSFQDSNKYAGLINSSVLRTLVNDWSIQFNAVLIAPHYKKDSVSKKPKVHKTSSSEECSVRIIVYGLASERSAVGDLLSDDGLYLQHPSISEYDRNVEYINPHYLLRPGAQMPNLEQLSINSDSGAEKLSESLDEANKTRFIRIFDLANEVGGPLTIQPSHRLRSTLQDHQLKALAMMSEKEHGILTESTFPSLWEAVTSSDAVTGYRHKVTGAFETLPRPAYGGILADEMGLGKTLSLLALICWSLDSLKSSSIASNNGESRVTLIIAPKSTICGWQEQVERHIHCGQLRFMIYYGNTRRNLSKELQNIDIVLTTYETMRNDWAAQGVLYTEKWYRVVLDEAHRIRTRSSQIFQAACAIKARHRWCLTGTPIQNSLDDYGALLSFVGIQPFAEKAIFDFWINGPVKQGRPDSLRKLEILVRATCLRRTKSLNTTLLELPQRFEKVELIELSPNDRELYNFFKLKTAEIVSQLSQHELGSGKAGQHKGTNIITLINFLRRICDHGEHLLPLSARGIWKNRSSSWTNWQVMRVFRAKCDICGVDVDDVDAPASIDVEYQCQHSICSKCAFRGQQEKTSDSLSCPKCNDGIASEGDTILHSSRDFIRPSAKVEKLIQNLRQEQFSELQGDQSLPRKSLVFSVWTKMLDLVQCHLQLDGFTVQRIDGQSSLAKRSEAMRLFRDDPKCTIMLAGIGSAGEGVDLTVANHVHLLEPHWNPMAEAQAVDRVHRIGQSREVVTTRYIIRDSIETYVQWIQQQKLRLIDQTLASTNVSQTEIDEERWKKLRSYMDCTRE